MATIQPLARPNYIKQSHPQQVNENQCSEPKFTKWDRIADLYKKVTDLVEVNRSKQGDEILERRINDHALTRGF